MTTTRCVLHHKGVPHLAVDGLLCADHAAALNEALTDVEELFAVVTLDAAIPLPSVAPSGAKHVKQAEAPAPGRLDVMALTDRRNWASGVRDDPLDLLVGELPDIPNVPGTLASWARTVCEERELDGATLDGTLTRTVKFLRAHRAWIYAQPWVDEYERELRSVRRLLAAMLGDDGPKPIGRCPTDVGGDGAVCGGPLWPDPAGRMQVSCGRCDRVFDETMLRHLGGMLEAG